MPEIKCVIAQIGPNQVTEGYYTLENDLLTMVHPDGKIVMLDDVRSVTATIKPGENVQAIAKVFTKQIRSHMRGEVVEGFGRIINYPTSGVA